MTIMQKLSKLTYAVQHNPNCRSPFLVRLIGLHQGVLDYKPVHETKDILGYGLTLAKAGREALKKSKKIRESG